MSGETAIRPVGLSSSTYATICAVLCGLADFIVWTGYSAAAFIGESVLHSVNRREPERIGPHDGYYGLAVCNAFSMLSTIAVPILMNYFRSKWILAMSGAFFTFYFISFPFLNRYLYFAASVFLGMAFSFYNIGYPGYLTEYSTRQTIERNQALMWLVSCLDVFGAGVIYFIVTALHPKKDDIISNYREYSDTEIRYFFVAFTILGVIGTVLFVFLPNREVENSIALSNNRNKPFKEQLAMMLSILVNKRVLILVPFYLYGGLFFSFWISIIPTTLQFTKHFSCFHVLSRNIYLPAYFGFSFTAGSVIMSVITMKMSSIVANFSFKPLMIFSAIIQFLIFAFSVCMIPQWSAVRPNDNPSLAIEPSVVFVLILAFLCGLASAANNTTRTVISSLILPNRRQQTFGASRFYHGLAASVLLFASPYLSIYSYTIILSAFLAVATIVYLYTCEHVQREEGKSSIGLNKITPETSENSKAN